MKISDKDKWKESVFEDHDRMVKNQVWRAVPKQDVPEHSNIMSSTWVVKKNSNGNLRATLFSRGYGQVDGQHYEFSNISSPVTNYANIRIIMVLLIIFKWSAQLFDAKEAFLCGNFTNGEEIYIEFPEGFEELYGAYVLLLLGVKHHQYYHEIRTCCMCKDHTEDWRHVLTCPLLDVALHIAD
jgi:hypothetical protein